MKTEWYTTKRRSGGSVVEFSPTTRDARVRFPASGSKKISFKHLSFALLANSSLKLDELSTQCGSMLYISLNLLFYPTGLFVYCGDSCYAMATD